MNNIIRLIQKHIFYSKSLLVTCDAIFAARLLMKI